MNSKKIEELKEHKNWYNAVLKNIRINFEDLKCEECGWRHFTPAVFDQQQFLHQQLGKEFPLKALYGKQVREAHITGDLIDFRGVNWRIHRKKCLHRDDRTCQICGDDGNVAHHIIPYRLSHISSPEVLVTLCKSCHHTIEDSITEIPDEHLRRCADFLLEKMEEHNDLTEEFMQQLSDRWLI